jgi:disulfide bond formation protein DsbB
MSRDAAGERRWLAALAGVSTAAVGVALISQHVFDKQPCPWCVLQRLIFIALAIVCAAGACLASRGARVAALLGADALATAGIAAALWHNIVAAKSASCDLTLADRIVTGLALDRLLPDVFAVRASCADAAHLLGVPYELWSLTLYVAIGAATSVLLVRAFKGGNLRP